MVYTFKMKKRKSILIAIIALFVATTISAQIPVKSNRLVNDYAGILSRQQLASLEQRLVAFSDSTSNQIVIVITPTLDSYTISDYAYQIGQTWGVGKAEYNNGLVIVIKPKNQTRGEAFIATGYGLEGTLPDIVCKEIVDDVMIPYFRDNDYYGGINAALGIILPVAAGEYSYEDAKADTSGFVVLGIFLGVLALAFILTTFASKNNKGNNIGGGDGRLDVLTAVWLASMAGRSHRGSFGGFSGGSGGFGGFGGFGGGSFGGGGAGGSW